MIMYSFSHLVFLGWEPTFTSLVDFILRFPRHFFLYFLFLNTTNCNFFVSSFLTEVGCNKSIILGTRQCIFSQGTCSVNIVKQLSITIM